ncbi:hypothetical protein PENTCL1PPCAC_23577, partial [Pristionchus entomophagus]
TPFPVKLLCIMSSCVHCNYCGKFPSPTHTSFCLSNCGHVFCKGCIDCGNLAGKCCRCGAAAPKFVTIDRNLNPNLQVMFKKPGQMVNEQSEELEPLMKFQFSQRNLRFKATHSMLIQEKGRRVELQSQMTTMRDQMKTMQRQFAERSRSRSRPSSREDTRSLSRGGDVSEMSHHQTMSSVGSNESSFMDPFKTPANGLKKFTTSTPKLPMPEGPREKRMIDNSMMNSRLSHSSTIPSLSSFSMEVDQDEIMDVTPAPQRDKSRGGLNTQQMLHGQPQLPSVRQKSSSKMEIDYDPILSSGSAKPHLPKTPAPPKKSMQSLSMAERLSGPHRAKTPTKIVQQPEVTASTPRPPTINRPRTPSKMPLVGSLATQHRLAPITPIRPIHGSQLPSSTVVSMKKPERFNSSAFKTPSLPVKKTTVPRTMPIMKTGMGSSGFAAAAAAAAHTVNSQPHK